MSELGELRAEYVFLFCSARHRGGPTAVTPVFLNT